ncbi:MAG: hypothetical protein CVV05_00670 [Gammaproteobacteria bacterium HGW-Gammaproteobacteria-1]|jgi:type IVB pilus formation R64 PilN family outer membrane protein|nr:MAG: hypothetical protein CVV05_00670 [Gammaproteobacteria bacterium HGW-Gammaproteobacteria-1]
MHKIILAVTIALTTIGCATLDYDDMSRTVEKREKDASAALAENAASNLKPEPQTDLKNENWVSPRSVPFRQPLPATLTAERSFNMYEKEPVTAVLARISRLAGVDVVVEQDIFVKASLQSGTTTAATTGLDSTGTALGTPSSATAIEGNRVIPKIQISYRGTGTGLLDRVTGEIGAQWRYERRDNRVVVYRYLTKSFTVSAQPGETNTEATVALNNNNQSGSTSTTKDTSKGDYSIWANLETSLRAVISNEGSYAVNEAAGTVLIRDLPHVVAQVEALMKDVNAQLEQGVILDFHVVSVAVDDSDSRSVAWDVLFDNNKIAANLSTPRTSILNTSFLLLGASANDTGKFQGTRAFIDSLAKVGKVSEVTSGVLISTNNKPAPLNFGETIFYIQNAESTQTANVGSSISVTQATVDVGFFMSFLPRVLENGSDLSLRISMIISRLLSIESKTFGTVTIEQPHIERRQLAPEVLMRSGQTLMIAGLSLVSESASKSGIITPDTWYLGGGREVSSLRNKLVIFITPRVYRPGATFVGNAAAL